MDKIRYFDMSDYRRSHLLPDHVTCNVARRLSLGDPGAWNVARGELVEACRATGARPVELRYAESPDPRHPRTTLTVTTSRMTLAGGRGVEVVTTRRSADRPGGVDSWSIAVDGRGCPAEVRVHMLSPAVIGSIVRRTIAIRPPTGPAAARTTRLRDRVVPSRLRRSGRDTPHQDRA